MKQYIITILLVLIGVLSKGQVTFCGEVLPLDKEFVKLKLVETIKKNKKAITDQTVQRRIKLYMPYIETVLQQYGIPDDIKFVPLAESKLSRWVVSPAGAKGPWQIMPAVGVDDGMNISLSGKGVDDRNTIIKSTHTACRLLKKVYKMYNSWTLTAAAFNYGPGNINRVIRKQGTKNYYEMRLNKETASYVYELVSYKLLYGMIENNEALNFYQAQKNILEQDKKILVARENEAEIKLTAATIVKAPLKSAGLEAEGWKSSGWSTEATNLSNPENDGIEQSERDSVLIPAQLIQGGYVENKGQLAFRTVEDAKIGSFQLRRNTVITGLIYATKGKRIEVTAAGINVNKELSEYDITVVDQDGIEGLNVIAKTKQVRLEEGQRIFIKIAKD